MGCWVGNSKLLSFNKFKKLSKALVDHLFECHEWCDAHWYYAFEVDESRVKYDAQAVAIAALTPSLLPTATATGNTGVPIQSTTEVIDPIVFHLIESQTTTTVELNLPPIATVTDGTEAQIRATTEFINPVVQIRASAEVPIQSVTEIINPTVCHFLVSQTAEILVPTLSSITTVTGGAEVQIRATTKAINSAVQIRAGSVVRKSATPPATPPLDNMSNNSSKFL